MRCCWRSASDVDDLIPTLVAFQIEWNKLHQRQLAAGWPPDHDPSAEECAQALGGSVEDWSRLRAGWGERFGERLRLIAERRWRCACGCWAAPRWATRA